MLTKMLAAARMRAVCLLFAIFEVSASSFPDVGRAQDKFDISPPASLAGMRKLDLWSTYYYIYSGRTVGDGAGSELRDLHDQGFGLSLSARDWCNAAVEGTVSVSSVIASVRTFNYAGTKDPLQVNCSHFFPNLNPKIGKSRFDDVPADAPFGLGDADEFRLVPFRSIAVDRGRSEFALRGHDGLRKVAIYVPRLKGVKIGLPDGTTKLHDGYLFAADTGGAIKGNHMDFFLGVSSQNPTPALIQSKPNPTFAAYLVDDMQVQETLYLLHLRRKGPK